MTLRSIGPIGRPVRLGGRLQIGCEYRKDTDWVMASRRRWVGGGRVDNSISDRRCHLWRLCAWSLSTSVYRRIRLGPGSDETAGVWSSGASCRARIKHMPTRRNCRVESRRRRRCEHNSQLAHDDYRRVRSDRAVTTQLDFAVGKFAQTRCEFRTHRRRDSTRQLRRVGGVY